MYSKTEIFSLLIQENTTKFLNILISFYSYHYEYELCNLYFYQIDCKWFLCIYKNHNVVDKPVNLDIVNKSYLCQ